MVFSFNFGSDSSDQDQKKEGSLGDERPSDISWRNAEEIFLDDSHLCALAKLPSYEQFELEGGTSINFVNSSIVCTLLKDAGYKGDLSPALGTEHSDLVPGTYEGGLKVWECSEDLTRFLYTSPLELAGMKVLDLGCGAALPGLYCFSKGAEVWFNDYNEEVLKHITMPNTLLNVPKDPAKTRFFAGDWESFKELVEPEMFRDDGKFDLILTSETIYNTKNQHKLISIFKNLLKKNGQVLVAAKTVYFGVGGGLRQFEGMLSQNGLNFASVKAFDEGVNREIVSVTL